MHGGRPKIAMIRLIRQFYATGLQWLPSFALKIRGSPILQPASLSECSAQAEHILGFILSSMMQQLSSDKLAASDFPSMTQQVTVKKLAKLHR